MINSTSKTDSARALDYVPPKPSATSGSSSHPSASETLSASSNETLRNLLKDQPEVRPDVVTRGQQLAVDGNYPPKMIIQKLSEMLVNSVDLAQ